MARVRYITNLAFQIQNIDVALEYKIIDLKPPNMYIINLKRGIFLSLGKEEIL